VLMASDAGRANPRWGRLERNRPIIVAALAAGASPTALGAQYGVAQQSVTQFAERHADEIDRVRREQVAGEVAPLIPEIKHRVAMMWQNALEVRQGVCAIADEIAALELLVATGDPDGGSLAADRDRLLELRKVLTVKAVAFSKLMREIAELAGELTLRAPAALPEPDGEDMLRVEVHEVRPRPANVQAPTPLRAIESA